MVEYYIILLRNTCRNTCRKKMLHIGGDQEFLYSEYHIIELATNVYRQGLFHSEFHHPDNVSPDLRSPGRSQADTHTSPFLHMRFLLLHLCSHPSFL